jgi:class 3 adenylate cyclase
MLDYLWPDFAVDFARGLLVGGASLAFQAVAAKTHRAVTRLRARWFPRRVAREAEAVTHRCIERRLAAILAADVVGYSRLSEVDEEGVHDRLAALRRKVVDPIIADHRGRIVKNTGDGALVEFASIVDAVNSAVKLQQALALHNAEVRQDQRIEFRIGVNLGDIIVEPDDIYGNGVNLAVRLEGLAASGGICLTADVWRCVRATIAAEVVDLGEVRLKNIAQPVHVYAIHPQSGSHGPCEVVSRAD